VNLADVKLSILKTETSRF